MRNSRGPWKQRFLLMASSRLFLESRVQEVALDDMENPHRSLGPYLQCGT